MVVFEKIKRLTESKKEYWSARELAKALKYADHRNFGTVLKKAKESCKNAGQSVKNHFVDVTKMIELGKGASRGVDDAYLTRYACYLIMQNADPQVIKLIATLVAPPPTSASAPAATSAPIATLPVCPLPSRSTRTKTIS